LDLDPQEKRRWRESKHDDEDGLVPFDKEIKGRRKATCVLRKRKKKYRQENQEMMIAYTRVAFQRFTRGGMGLLGNEETAKLLFLLVKNQGFTSNWRRNLKPWLAKIHEKVLATGVVWVAIKYETPTCINARPVGSGRRFWDRVVEGSRTGNTCVRAAQRPETGSSAQDLSTLPTGV